MHPAHYRPLEQHLLGAALAQPGCDGARGLEGYLGQNLKVAGLGGKSAVNNRGLRTSFFPLLGLRFLI